MKLLTQTLIDEGACVDQVKLFRKHFGHGGTVTLEKCLAVTGLFDWNWAATRLLKAPARAEYDRALATAWAEYDRAMAPARAEYSRARAATAWAEYSRARAATAWAEYAHARASALDRALDRAWAEYDRALATAFYEAWKQQEG